jgi:hypothetical protein
MRVNRRISKSNNPYYPKSVFSEGYILRGKKEHVGAKGGIRMTARFFSIPAWITPLLWATIPSSSAAPDCPVREPPKLYLVRPLRGDAETLASEYSLLTKTISAGLERLAKDHPEIDAHWEGRVGEFLVVVGAFVPKYVMEHELGHARTVISSGGHPRIRLIHWYEGVTDWPPIPDEDSSQAAMDYAGGLNQAAATSRYVYTEWARNGCIRYQEALEYLMAHTDLARYELGGVPDEMDDIKNYLTQLGQKGLKLSRDRVVLLAAVSVLASKPAWAAAGGQYNYLAKGKRWVRVPSFKVGRYSFTCPSFHTYLSRNGPVVGGDMLVNPAAPHPLGISLHIRYDGRAQALGVRWYALRFSSLTVSPFVRGTIDTRPGIATGAEIRYRTGGSVDVISRLEYVHNDLIAEPQGQSDGVNAYAGLAFAFR